jgi:hypothetical protein
MAEASSHAEEVQISKPTGHQIYFPLKNSCTINNLSQPWDFGVEPKEILRVPKWSWQTKWNKLGNKSKILPPQSNLYLKAKEKEKNVKWKMSKIKMRDDRVMIFYFIILRLLWLICGSPSMWFQLNIVLTPEFFWASLVKDSVVFSYSTQRGTPFLSVDFVSIGILFMDRNHNRN